MIRATEILPAGAWDRAAEADSIELPHDGRHRRRIAMRGARDTVFLLDLPEAATLQDGDGLKLQDGRIVRVVSAMEPVAYIRAHSPEHLARIAWHLGSRHVPAQMAGDGIRIGRDPALEAFLVQLGGQISHLEAAFDPESAAKVHAPAGSGHHHHHAHDHGHHHDHDHEHGPGCGCGHNH